MLSQDEIDQIQKRIDNATGGPWTSWIEGRDFDSGSSVITTAGEDIYLAGAGDADQDFIAAARQDLPRLLAEIVRLQEIIRNLQSGSASAEVVEDRKPGR